MNTIKVTDKSEEARQRIIDVLEFILESLKGNTGIISGGIIVTPRDIEGKQSITIETNLEFALKDEENV